MAVIRTWLHRSVAVCIHCAVADMFMPRRSETGRLSVLQREVANIACHSQLEQSRAVILVLLISVISGLKGG